MEKIVGDSLAKKNKETYQQEKAFPICLALDNIRSAMNTGSFFRIADSLRLEGLILGGFTARPPHQEIHKTALGATETVTWEHVQELKERIIDYKNKQYTIIVIEQTNQSIPLSEFNISLESKYCIVFGNEVTGVQADILSLADIVLEIPQYGIKHSLNVAVCAGIVSWHLVNQYLHLSSQD